MISQCELPTPALRRSSAEPHADWDRFVERCPGGDLVQTTAWATTKRGVGMQTSLTTAHGSDGEIVGGGLVIIKEVLTGVRLGYVPRGPVINGGSDSAATVVDGLISSARSKGVQLLIIQPPLGGEACEPALTARGFEPGCPGVAPEATIRLDLTRTDEQLLAGMSEMRRRNVRKAMKSQLVIEQDDDVALFQRLHSATAARQRFVPIDLATLRAQWDVLAPAGHCAMFIARHEGKPVAGLWLTSFAGVVTFKLAGWDASIDSVKNANEALHWTAMRWARSTGAHTYDLGGFDRRATELITAGQALPPEFTKTPAFFKLGFGGTPILLPKARWSFIGSGQRLLQAPARWMFTTPWAKGIANRLRSV
jgi:peptidoglycan pentaglycine glycine transferase (the first glycine)